MIMVFDSTDKHRAGIEFAVCPKTTEPPSIFACERLPPTRRDLSLPHGELRAIALARGYEAPFSLYRAQRKV